MRTPKREITLSGGELVALLENYLRETVGATADVLQIDVTTQLSRNPFNVFPGPRRDTVLVKLKLDEEQAVGVEVELAAEPEVEAGGITIENPPQIDLGDSDSYPSLAIKPKKGGGRKKKDG